MEREPVIISLPANSLRHRDRRFAATATAAAFGARDGRFLDAARGRFAARFDSRPFAHSRRGGFDARSGAATATRGFGARRVTIVRSVARGFAAWLSAFDARRFLGCGRVLRGVHAAVVSDGDFGFGIGLAHRLFNGGRGLGRRSRTGAAATTTARAFGSGIRGVGARRERGTEAGHRGFVATVLDGLDARRGGGHGVVVVIGRSHGAGFGQDFHRRRRGLSAPALGAPIFGAARHGRQSRFAEIAIEIGAFVAEKPRREDVFSKGVGAKSQAAEKCQGEKSAKKQTHDH